MPESTIEELKEEIEKEMLVNIKGIVEHPDRYDGPIDLLDQYVAIYKNFTRAAAHPQIILAGNDNQVEINE